MENFKSMDHILDFAMNQEQSAVDFYTKLAAKSRNEEMKQIFEEFAREEIGHKAKISQIKEEQNFNLPKEKVAALKIADYIAYPDVDENITYEDALKVAMAREKAAFKLYTKLASEAPTQAIRSIFQYLAQEESKHKLRFELEYDEFVLRDN
ncbi:MAG: hypothetical protein A2W93_08735 [Bacteroidetes bacterium GWF2_43_63]|nr:MAG: hypothetical protein A2W94_03060 [Bacteroidetes bacterium GWE2_42_42]OFY55217.1 MAG: hypothetical protein A2W93_08735 [Bacteroidetes bacterium GWF2_43_63]HBG70906.1 rubrerythrin [Bacteroidales bacterium]HCB63330.1 rubrerythrin [Bacteroidales bacterium]HCY23033.1 rubrerythrin [Bacteroidales bacterium]